MTGADVAAALCRIVADVLDLDQVGPRDGFFEVGGDSVLALQVVARARDAGLTFSVRDLFDHQTPEALAAATQGRGGQPLVGMGEEPLLTYADDELDEFEDTGENADDMEAGWETVT